MHQLRILGDKNNGDVLCFLFDASKSFYNELNNDKRCPKQLNYIHESVKKNKKLQQRNFQVVNFHTKTSSVVFK